MSSSYTISATIYFLSPEEGGRQTPIFSGYRPALYFGEKQTDGAIILTSGDRAVPGTECEVVITLLHSEHLGDTLKPMATSLVSAKSGGFPLSKAVGQGCSDAFLTPMPLHTLGQMYCHRRLFPQWPFRHGDLGKIHAQ